jgi:hypothetical protein
MNLSPKTRFQKTDDAKAHQSLVKSDSFLNALTSALAEMEIKMPDTGNPSAAWDCHCQMVGAKKFINTLLNLAEVTTEPERPKTDLNYKT